MNSFNSQATLKSGNKSYTIFRLPALAAQGLNLSRLPFSLKILLENLLRREDGVNVTADDIEFLAKWDAKAEPSREIAYMPARVLMQDFTGVPAIVDLGAMRDAIKTLGGDPEQINPLIPPSWSSTTRCRWTSSARRSAYEANSLLEFQRNRERYAFLKWGQTAFRNFSRRAAGHGHLPPGESRVSGARRVHHRSERRTARVSRHAGRHRLAHHDDQRPRRAGLGRRRHRGRGGNARPAGLHAGAAGRRVTSSPANCAKARPQPTWCSP